MLRAGRPEDQGFADTELLYHRVPPDYVHEYEAGKFRVVTWNHLHNISVVRSKYGSPDHARWDSTTPPEGEQHFEFKPQLYREYWVARIAVGDLPPELHATTGQQQKYTFHAMHVPFDDLYSHSEIRAKKNGVLVKQRNKFGSEEVKARYRAALTNVATLILKPDQINVPVEKAVAPASPAPVASPPEAAAVRPEAEESAQGRHVDQESIED